MLKQWRIFQGRIASGQSIGVSDIPAELLRLNRVLRSRSYIAWRYISIVDFILLPFLQHVVVRSRAIAVVVDLHCLQLAARTARTPHTTRADRRVDGVRAALDRTAAAERGSRAVHCEARRLQGDRCARSRAVHCKYCDTRAVQNNLFMNNTVEERVARIQREIHRRARNRPRSLRSASSPRTQHCCHLAIGDY